MEYALVRPVPGRHPSRFILVDKSKYSKDNFIYPYCKSLSEGNDENARKVLEFLFLFTRERWSSRCVALWMGEDVPFVFEAAVRRAVSVICVGEFCRKHFSFKNY